MSAVNFELVPFPHHDHSVNPESQQLTDFSISGKLHLTKTDIRINYYLTGNRQSIQYSVPQKRGTRQDNLWRTTCFELFIREKNQPEYWEYNLSPSGDWNIFFFTNYRENKTPELSIANIPVTASTDDNGLLEIAATLPIPSNIRGRRFQIGISCVLEKVNGTVFYLALTHNKTQPDFHDSSSFILSI